MKLFRQSGDVSQAVRLQNGRVIMRIPHDADWRQYAELRAASRTFLQPWEPTWPPDSLTRAAFQRRVRRYEEEWRESTGFSFFVFGNGGGAANEELCGGIGITNIRRGVSQSGTLGYWMGQAHAGQGLMGETLPAMLKFCFDDLQLHRIEAACLPTNERSRRLLERAGFVREGYASKYLKICGEWCDHLLFGLCADEYQAG